MGWRWNTDKDDARKIGQLLKYYITHLWPFMLRSTHESGIEELKRFKNEQIQTLTDTYQGLVNAEYARARDAGRRQVRAWAVDKNYDLFLGQHPFQDMNGLERSHASSALQQAADEFNPARTKLEDHKED